MNGGLSLHITRNLRWTRDTHFIARDWRTVDQVTMFLFMLFTISHVLFSSKGQPMSPYCMHFPPREGDALHRMILPCVLGYQNLALDPLVNPLLPIPCEVAHAYIPKPHWLERQKNGKWKTVKIQEIPFGPCVVKFKPKEIVDSSTTHLPSDLEAAGFSNTTLDSDTGKQNITIHDPMFNSSATWTGNETASQIDQFPVENGTHDKSTESTCTEKPDYTAEGNQNFNNPEIGNTTSSSAETPECKSASLVALDCLARVIAMNPLNATVNGTILMKKSDNRLGPIDYMAVEASVSKNSSCSHINTELTCDQMRLLENCLADDNDPEPYLVNGHPLIVKLQYVNQTEKQHILTKKIGHDFVVAIPHEVELGKHKHTLISDKPDNQLSVTDHDVPHHSTRDPEDEWLTIFEKTILSKGKINVRERKTRQETKVVNQTSNELPHINNSPTKSINDDSLGNWKIDEECYDHTKENSHQPSTLHTPHDQVSHYDRLNSEDLIPIPSQYYSTRNTVYITASDRLARLHSLNYEYPEEETVPVTEPYPAQPAPLLCGRQIQRAREVMNDHNNDCCLFIETLEHDTRLNPKIRLTSRNVAIQLNRADLLHKPHKKRSNEVKYEKCRIQSLEKLKGMQSRHDTNTCGESRVSIGSFRSNPEPHESLYSNPDSASWHENYCPQELQIQPPNYMSQDLEHWRRLPTILQPSLPSCSGQMCEY